MLGSVMPLGSGTAEMKVYPRRFRNSQFVIGDEMARDEDRREEKLPD